mmetsp:Transcript_9808/g.29640  ORF Transcript_9808/g.29640 Transcript_9808/m.29640 type:complete len:675 (+) Transcript_9808:92-2116(+)
MAAEAQRALAELSGGMKGVSHKIAHIGNLLENKHHARKRAMHARKVMEHFDAFHSGDELLSPFSDKEPDLKDCAKIIQQLEFICAQLPDDKFGKTTARIKKKFDEIEADLLSRFENADKLAMAKGLSTEAAKDEIKEMNKWAHTLFPFDSYQKCVEGFIGRFIKQYASELEIPEPGAAFTKTSINKVTDAIAATSKNAKSTIDRVFRYPQQIVAQFLQEIMKTVQFKYIKVILVPDDDYLDRLHETYERTKELLERLTKDLEIADQSGLFQENLLRKLFDEYLGSTYISMEEDSLTEHYNELVKESGLGGRSARASFARKEEVAPGRPTKGGKKSKADKRGRGHVRSGSNTVDADIPARLFEGGTLLSQDVALLMIHENQKALRRCQVLGKSTELPSLAKRIFFTLLQGLGEEYVQRGLEFGTTLLKARGPLEVTIKYLDLVHNANSIVYLLQKHFWDTVLPLVRPQVNEHQECVNHKGTVLQHMEVLISDGLAQCLKTAIGHCATTLSKTQRRSDFCPADDSNTFMTETCTEACKQTTAILTRVAAAIKGSLNGKNETAAFAELGRRFYDTIVGHFRTLGVNELGTMLLTRDISEYEKCISAFGNAHCNELLDHIKKASSILMVRAENVQQLCHESQMSKVPPELLHIFARLRSDYKQANLAQHFLVEKPDKH